MKKKKVIITIPLTFSGVWRKSIMKYYSKEGLHFGDFILLYSIKIIKA